MKQQNGKSKTRRARALVSESIEVKGPRVSQLVPVPVAASTWRPLLVYAILLGVTILALKACGY